MNYIVFDLEWNQCPYGKCREEARLPFEIIEIGAVKLNKNREYVEEFHRIIKPAVYKSSITVQRRSSTWMTRRWLTESVSGKLSESF